MITSMFGSIDKGSHTMFNMFMQNGKVNEQLKTFPEDKPQSYYYFAKLIPHTFVDMIQKREWRSYSYSLAHNKKSNETPTFSGMVIILDYAPVKMILTKQQREFGQFAINLCSIIGGVFIISGLINSFMLGIVNKFKSD